MKSELSISDFKKRKSENISKKNSSQREFWFYFL